MLSDHPPAPRQAVGGFSESGIVINWFPNSDCHKLILNGCDGLGRVPDRKEDRSMKKWLGKILLGGSLIACSAIFYLLHYVLFHDAHHIFVYLVGDIAPTPIL